MKQAPQGSVQSTKHDRLQVFGQCSPGTWCDSCGNGGPQVGVTDPRRSFQIRIQLDEQYSLHNIIILMTQTYDMVHKNPDVFLLNKHLRVPVCSQYDCYSSLSAIMFSYATCTVINIQAPQFFLADPIISLLP